MRVTPRALSARFEVTQVLLTRELYETIGRAEVDGIRRSIAGMQRLYPNAGAESIEVGGGLAAFTGVDSPLSKTFGLGTFGPARAEDIPRISHFYASRNAVARVFVTPFLDPAVSRTLVAAGYTPVDYDSVMVAVDPDRHALRDDRIVLASDFDAWARASAHGFMGPDASDDSLARIIGSSESVTPLEVREDGEIAATAAFSVSGDCAAFFAGSTLLQFRNRGLQLALIRDRLARARESGAQIIFASAEPASASERNFHRSGFVTLYTRARWDRINDAH